MSKPVTTEPTVCHRQSAGSPPRPGAQLCPLGVGPHVVVSAAMVPRNGVLGGPDRVLGGVQRARINWSGRFTLPTVSREGEGSSPAIPKPVPRFRHCSLRRSEG